MIFSACALLSAAAASTVSLVWAGSSLTSTPSLVAAVFAASKLVFVTSLVVTVVLPSSVTLTTFFSVESATAEVLSSTASVASTAGVAESVLQELQSPKEQKPHQG